MPQSEPNDPITSLRTQLAAAEAHAASLRAQLQAAESRLAPTSPQAETSPDDKPSPPSPFPAPDPQSSPSPPSAPPPITDAPSPWPLSPDEYRRYGRQLILPEVGLPGQLRLRGARVLIVGVGGLGCPAAAYLAGAGVGALGLVDGDVVEASNLHRQILHTVHAAGLAEGGWEKGGEGKVESARKFLKALNPLVECRCYPFHLSAETALGIVEEYDLVLDCTDHPTSRYLISDACVLAGKPLVSASALRMDGQLIVLNNPPKPPGDKNGGPCYRCIFPRPPPADSVLSCGEGGILGPVVGTMGVLQALEAIKILVAAPESPSSEPISPKASMLMFSAYSSPPFRQIRMRSRHVSCATCSSSPSVTRESLLSGSLDYVTFCGGRTEPLDLLDSESRTSATEFAQLPRDEGNVLIDVRDSTQYGICALQGSYNVPWTGNAETWVQRARDSGAMPATGTDCYVVCRFGNDSQLAVSALLGQMSESDRPTIRVRDIRGGFEAWRREVDSRWPEY